MENAGRGTQVARERSAKPLCASSILARASNPIGLQVRTRSFAALRISPAGSRCAHARKAAQVRFSPAPPALPPIDLTVR